VYLGAPYAFINKVFLIIKKIGERGEGGKTPEKLKNRRKPKDPYKTSPHNPKTKTSHQRPSCLARLEPKPLAP